jgi:hypothetical protein
MPMSIPPITPTAIQSGAVAKTESRYFPSHVPPKMQTRISKPSVPASPTIRQGSFEFFFKGVPFPFAMFKEQFLYKQKLIIHGHFA